MAKKWLSPKTIWSLVDLVMHQPEGKRQLGLLTGTVIAPDNIMEEDASINEMFYGETNEDNHWYTYFSLGAG